MKKPTKKPKIKLVGMNGNSYNILGIAKKALSGNYDHLLLTTMEYCEVD